MPTSVWVVATSLARTVKSTREQVSTGILQSHCMLMQIMIFIAFTRDVWDVAILRNISALAAAQVQFVESQNYTITEGDVVNITLTTYTSGYMFDFTVALQYMNGTATSESFNCKYEAHAVVMGSYTPVLPSIHYSSQWLCNWSIPCDLQCWSNVSHLDGVYHGWQLNRTIRVL